MLRAAIDVVTGVETAVALTPAVAVNVTVSTTGVVDDAGVVMVNGRGPPVVAATLAVATRQVAGGADATGQVWASSWPVEGLTHHCSHLVVPLELNALVKTRTA